MLDQTMTHDNDNKIAGGLQAPGAGPGRRTPTHSPAPAHQFDLSYLEGCVWAFFWGEGERSLYWLEGALCGLMGVPWYYNPYKGSGATYAAFEFKRGHERARLLIVEMGLDTPNKIDALRRPIEARILEKQQALQ